MESDIGLLVCLTQKQMWAYMIILHYFDVLSHEETLYNSTVPLFIVMPQIFIHGKNYCILW